MDTGEECGAGVKECILAIREETIRGIVLAGGSAFGLGAADGVMQYLEERDMGYEACANAQKGNYRDGNYGAGCGATVGKIASMDFCMKSGIGSYAIQLGGLLDEDKKSFRRTEDVMYASTEVVWWKINLPGIPPSGSSSPMGALKKRLSVR